jgi:hypothetical protein
MSRGEVKKQEARAVEMLRSLCDPERFSIYLQWGDIPARGTLTGHMYLVRRFARVAEFVDGKQHGEWCIHIDKNKFPETDNIVALKNMIEGGESMFRETANFFGDPSWWEKTLPPIPHILDIM